MMRNGKEYIFKADFLREGSFVWQGAKCDEGKACLVKKSALHEPGSSSSSSSDRKTAQARLFCEASLACRVQHKSLLQLTDVLLLKGRLRLVYEPAAGTLPALQKQRLQAGFKDHEVRQLVYQLVAAVAHLHDTCIGHHGIRPQCITLDQDGRLKLAGLDSARVLPPPHEKLLLPGNQARAEGTVANAWSAPEVVLGDLFGYSADIWSIGCICAELLSGRPLFPGSKESEILWSIFKGNGMCSRHVAIAQSRKDSKEIFKSSADCDPDSFRKKFGGYEQSTCSFLKSCLDPDPNKRATIRELLSSDYLSCVPDAALRKQMFDEHERLVDLCTPAALGYLTSTVATMELEMEELGVHVIAAAEAVGIGLQTPVAGRAFGPQSSILKRNTSTRSLRHELSMTVLRSTSSPGGDVDDSGIAASFRFMLKPTLSSVSMPVRRFLAAGAAEPDRRSSLPSGAGILAVDHAPAGGSAESIMKWRPPNPSETSSPRPASPGPASCLMDGSGGSGASSTLCPSKTIAATMEVAALARSNMGSRFGKLRTTSCDGAGSDSSSPVGAAAAVVPSRLGRVTVSDARARGGSCSGSSDSCATNTFGSVVRQGRHGRVSFAGEAPPLSPPDDAPRFSPGGSRFGLEACGQMSAPGISVAPRASGSTHGTSSSRHLQNADSGLLGQLDILLMSGSGATRAPALPAATRPIRASGTGEAVPGGEGGSGGGLSAMQQLQCSMNLSGAPIRTSAPGWLPDVLHAMPPYNSHIPGNDLKSSLPSRHSSGSGASGLPSPRDASLSGMRMATPLTAEMHSNHRQRQSGGSAARSKLEDDDYWRDDGPQQPQGRELLMRFQLPLPELSKLQQMLWGRGSVPSDVARQPQPPSPLLARAAQDSPRGSPRCSSGGGSCSGADERSHGQARESSGVSLSGVPDLASAAGGPAGRMTGGSGSALSNVAAKASLIRGSLEWMNRREQEGEHGRQQPQGGPKPPTTRTP